MWLRTVAATEDKIVLAKQNIHGSFEVRRRRDDCPKREQLAERLGLLVGYFQIKYLVVVVSKDIALKESIDSLLGSKFGKRKYGNWIACGIGWIR